MFRSTAALSLTILIAFFVCVLNVPATTSAQENGAQNTPGAEGSGAKANPANAECTATNVGAACSETTACPNGAKTTGICEGEGKCKAVTDCDGKAVSNNPESPAAGGSGGTSGTPAPTITPNTPIPSTPAAIPAATPASPVPGQPSPLNQNNQTQPNANAENTGIQPNAQGGIIQTIENFFNPKPIGSIQQSQEPLDGQPVQTVQSGAPAPLYNSSTFSPQAPSSGTDVLISPENANGAASPSYAQYLQTLPSGAQAYVIPSGDPLSATAAQNAAAIANTNLPVVVSLGDQGVAILRGEDYGLNQTGAISVSGTGLTDTKLQGTDLTGTIMVDLGLKNPVQPLDEKLTNVLQSGSLAQDVPFFSNTNTQTGSTLAQDVAGLQTTASQQQGWGTYLSENYPIFGSNPREVVSGAIQDSNGSLSALGGIGPVPYSDVPPPQKQEVIIEADVLLETRVPEPQITITPETLPEPEIVEKLPDFREPELAANTPATAIEIPAATPAEPSPIEPNATTPMLTPSEFPSPVPVPSAPSGGTQNSGETQGTGGANPETSPTETPASGGNPAASPSETGASASAQANASIGSSAGESGAPTASTNANSALTASLPETNAENICTAAPPSCTAPSQAMCSFGQWSCANVGPNSTGAGSTLSRALSLFANALSYVNPISSAQAEPQNNSGGQVPLQTSLQRLQALEQQIKVQQQIGSNPANRNMTGLEALQTGLELSDSMVSVAQDVANNTAVAPATRTNIQNQINAFVTQKEPIQDKATHYIVNQDILKTPQFETAVTKLFTAGQALIDSAKDAAAIPTRRPVAGASVAPLGVAQSLTPTGQPLFTTRPIIAPTQPAPSIVQRNPTPVLPSAVVNPNGNVLMPTPVVMPPPVRQGSPESAGGTATPNPNAVLPTSGGTRVPAPVVSRPGPYNPASGQPLADAVNAACKAVGCNAPLIQKAFGGVCGIESECNAQAAHAGSQYQGFGQVGTAETQASINQLYKLAQSPNLSPQEQAQVKSVADAARNFRGNPNADSILGPWMLVGNHLAVGSLAKVSAATNDPRTAAAYLMTAQFAPVMFQGNFGPNSILTPSAVNAYNKQGWIPISNGTSVGQAAQRMLSVVSASGKIDKGIAYASQFSPSGSPAPIPTNYAGTAAPSAPPPPGGWKGTTGTPTIAAGNPGYAPGINRVAQCPSGAPCYQDPQTGARGVPTDPSMTADQFARAAREDIAMERLAQKGALPQGAHFGNFVAVQRGGTALNPGPGTPGVTGSVTGANQPTAGTALTGTPSAQSRLTGNIPAGANPIIVASMQQASKYLPQGYTVKIVSASRTNSTVGSNSYHLKRDPTGNSLAIDVSIVNAQGQTLCNLRCPDTFQVYREFMQNVKAAQDQLFPQYASQGRWGGYFVQGVAQDQMHYDLGGANVTAAGNWQSGLSAQYESYGGSGQVGQGMGQSYQTLMQNASGASAVAAPPTMYDIFSVDPTTGAQTKVASGVPLPSDAVGANGAVRLLTDANGNPLGQGGQKLADGTQPLLVSADSTLPKATPDPTNKNLLNFTDDRPVPTSPWAPNGSGNPYAGAQPQQMPPRQQQQQSSSGSPQPQPQPAPQRPPLQQPTQPLPQPLPQPIISPISPTPNPTQTNPQPIPAPRPVVILLANPTTVAKGGTSRISWSSSGVTQCNVTASGGFAIGTGTSSTAITPPLTTNTLFTAICQSPFNGQITATTSVMVR